MKLVFVPIIIAGGDSRHEISPVGCLKIGPEKFTRFSSQDFLEDFFSSGRNHTNKLTQTLRYKQTSCKLILADISTIFVNDMS